MRPRVTAFSLVELLVVLAIISVLAAMLLPSVDQALEQSRRVVCASNQRQLTIAISNYAEDWSGRLPYHTCSWRYTMRGCIAYQGVNSPVRQFLTNYTDSPVGYSNGGAGAYGLVQRSGIAICPSARVLMTPFQAPYPAHYLSFMSYSFEGFGAFNCTPAAGPGATMFASPRYDALGRSGPLGPIAFLTDVCVPVASSESLAGEEGLNHDYAGGNVTDASGACMWTDASAFLNTGAGYAVPRGRYAPTSAGGSVWSAASAGTLHLFTPTGATSTASPENRRLYGYRQ